MDTAFTLGISIGFLFFVLIFLLAPVTAWIFTSPDLTFYVRFLSYTAFTTAFALPSVLWDREMRFGIAKVPRFAAIIANTAVALLCAKVLNLGTWSLFWGNLAFFLVSNALIWLMVPYHPRPRFQRELARELFCFGWPLVIGAVFGFILWRYDDIMVRYFWGNETLGYYTVAFYMPMFITDIVQMISNVLFPAFTKLQHDTTKLEYAFTLSNKYIAIFIVPLGIGMCIFAPEIIYYLYSDKWAPAIPVLQILAIAFLVRVVTGYNWSLLAVGRGKTRIPMIANVTGCIINVGLGILIIPRYGMMGAAALNLFLVITAGNVFKYIVIMQELGSIRFINQVWKPVLSGALAGGPIFLLKRAPGALTLLPLVAFLFTFSLLYAIVLLMLEGRKLLLETRNILKVSF